jgi:hypothetical protein
MFSIFIAYESALNRLTFNQTVAGEHTDTGGNKNDNEGPSKKKKKIEKGLFNVQWKVNSSA